MGAGDGGLGERPVILYVDVDVWALTPRDTYMEKGPEAAMPLY